MQNLRVIILLLSLTISMSLSAQDFKENRHEVSIGYGTCTAPQIGTALGSIFFSAFTFDMLDSGDVSGDWGSVNLAYNYRLTKLVGLGLSAGYCSMNVDWKNESLIGKQKYNYYSILPTLKLNWLNSKIVALYSKAALGITICNSKMSYADKTTADRTETDITWGFQVSTIGIEVGKRIAGFAELGFGNMGIFQVGVRARL